jgi:hypothetical protein
VRRALVILAAVAVAGIAAAVVFAALYFGKGKSAAPAGTTTTTARAPCGDERAFGHLRSLVRVGDHYVLRFDPAWFTLGATANDAAAQDGVVAPGEPVPNDNYVVDESHRTYLYIVPSTARVKVLTPNAYLTGSPVSVKALAQLVAGKHPVKLFEPLDTGFWIRFHVDTVCSLQQQYQP